MLKEETTEEGEWIACRKERNKEDEGRQEGGGRVNERKEEMDHGEGTRNGRRHGRMDKIGEGINKEGVKREGHGGVE